MVINLSQVNENTPETQQLIQEVTKELRTSKEL